MLKPCTLLFFALVIVGCRGIPRNFRNVQGHEYLGTLRIPSTNNSREFDENDYYASAFAGVWNTAVQDCQDTFGPTGHLVSIEDEGESNAINAWLEDRGSGGATFWTSGQFTFENGWVWAATGGAVQFTSWNVGQPVPNPHGRHRIGLNHLNQFAAGWDAIEDSETRRYICERRNGNPGSTTTTTTTTQPPITVPVPCSTTLDLVIVLDSSGSIGPANFVVLKQFVALLASAFTSHPDTLFGLVVYSEGVEIPVGLVPSTPEDINSRILSARYHAGPTPTDQGISAATGMLRATSGRAMKQRMLVITDGISNEPDKTREESDIANGYGIETFSLGISENVSFDELLGIAGGHNERMFVSNGWDDLMELQRALSVALC